MRYMKNITTGSIFPFNPDVVGKNSDVVECNQFGTPVGVPERAVEEIYSLNNQLTNTINELNNRIQSLENENIALQRELDSYADRKNDTESLTISQLREKAKQLGIASSGSKAELIERINAAGCNN